MILIRNSWVFVPGVGGKNRSMAKSGRWDRTRGALDKLAGRVLDALSKVTGRRSTAAKGKAARIRGGARTSKGRSKRKKK